jgi:hypothetical protein
VTFFERESLVPDENEQLPSILSSKFVSLRMISPELSQDEIYHKLLSQKKNKQTKVFDSVLFSTSIVMEVYAKSETKTTD